MSLPELSRALAQIESDVEGETKAKMYRLARLHAIRKPSAVEERRRAEKAERLWRDADFATGYLQQVLVEIRDEPARAAEKAVHALAWLEDHLKGK